MMNSNFRFARTVLVAVVKVAAGAADFSFADLGRYSDIL